MPKTIDLYSIKPPGKTPCDKYYQQLSGKITHCSGVIWIPEQDATIATSEVLMRSPALISEKTELSGASSMICLREPSTSETLNAWVHDRFSQLPDGCHAFMLVSKRLLELLQHKLTGPKSSWETGDGICLMQEKDNEFTVHCLPAMTAP